MQVALVAVGGAIGSVVRFGIQKGLNVAFPFGTLTVNLVGCFLIGLLWALSIKGLNEDKRLLMMTGFCGGFTTFSAFTLEAMQMLNSGKSLNFFLYTIASVAFGLGATFLGYKLFS